jgi:hypothetical protein
MELAKFFASLFWVLFLLFLTCKKYKDARNSNFLFIQAKKNFLNASKVIYCIIYFKKPNIEMVAPLIDLV